MVLFCGQNNDYRNQYNTFSNCQVWFQNARAKWRRTKGQEGGALGSGQGSNENNSISGPGGPNSSSSGLSGPEDGEIGGVASPSSDCSGPMIPCY